MATETTKQQSLNFGSLVIDAQTGSVNHYVEKPSSYVSCFINCGIYVCSLDVFFEIAQVFRSRELNYSNGNSQNRDQGYIEWEREVLTKLAGSGKLFALPVNYFFKKLFPEAGISLAIVFTRAILDSKITIARVYLVIFNQTNRQRKTGLRIENFHINFNISLR